MNDLLAKLIAKKGADDEIDPDYKNSKLSVLQQLKDEMTKMMAGDLSGAANLKKVTVAAPDQAGLKDGLAKAQELMGKGTHLDDDSEEDDDDDKLDATSMPAMQHEHVADDEDDSEDSDSGMAHPSDDSLDAMSPEELKALVKQLQLGGK